MLPLRMSGTMFPGSVRSRVHLAQGPAMIDSVLLDLLVCPACGGTSPLHADEAVGLLICDQCRRGYPVHDGIPIMLVEEAVQTNDVASSTAADAAPAPPPA